MRSLFIASMLLLSVGVFAQGLTFSQVLTPAGSVAAGTTFTIGPVPAGKVWKLENAAIESNVLDCYFVSTNGVRVYIGDGFNGIFAPTGNTSSGAQFRAMWMKAGDIIEVDNIASSSTHECMFSIIEFNAP